MNEGAFEDNSDQVEGKLEDSAGSLIAGVKFSSVVAGAQI